MLQRLGIFSILVFFVLGVSGCVTTRKRTDLEVQGLKNQVSVLEQQLREKEEEINNLKESLESMKGATASNYGRLKVIPESKYRPSVKQIQIALANAGYNPGSIDGRMGKKTREAIRAFQRANDLAVDGKIGRKTWALLSQYLYKKVK